MSENDNERLLEELKRCANAKETDIEWRNVKLPTQIRFRWDRDNNTVVMELDDRAIGVRTWKKGQDNPNWNMQSDGAAFEAWALILHARLDTHPKIRLERQGQGVLPEAGSFYIADGLRAGHYNRFLYRLMKFDEAYPWFEIGDTGLSARAGESRLLRDNTDNTFCNNIPESAAGVREESESMVEAAFEADQSLLAGFAEAGTVHRQLPVGLFQGEKSQETRVFTGGKSAIDLWAAFGGTLTVFELKTCNKMVGIITELMFYCNYMRDMYIEENSFRPLDPNLSRRRNLKKLRGYDKLWERKETLTEVRGYLLVDVLHPLITEEVLGEMSASGIPYDVLQYDWDPAAQVPVSNVRKWFERPASPDF